MSFSSRHHLTLASLIVAAVMLFLSSAQASGTYPPAPPKLRSDVVRDIDPQAYNLGKSIFVGRADLKAMPPAATQQASQTRQQLDEIIALIPERAREQLDISGLSRVLDQTSADALVYYLKLRFRVTETSTG